MKKKKQLIISGIVILLTLLWAMNAFKSSLTSYVTIAEAKKIDKNVQVAGLIVKGSASYDIDKGSFYFKLREEGGDELSIKYNGAKPSNFDDAVKAVAVGKYNTDSSVFICNELLVKCPSKYEGRIKEND